MHLSEIGQEPEKRWQEIRGHFPFLILVEFIVMPNHAHRIVIIDKPCDGGRDSVENSATIEDQIDQTRSQENRYCFKQSEQKKVIFLGITNYGKKD